MASRDASPFPAAALDGATEAAAEDDDEDGEAREVADVPVRW